MRKERGCPDSRTRCAAVEVRTRECRARRARRARPCMHQGESHATVRRAACSLLPHITIHRAHEHTADPTGLSELPLLRVYTGRSISSISMPAAVRRRAAASTSASGSHSAARREASHSGGSSTGGAGSSRGGEADSVRHEQLIRLASIELSGSPSLKDACVQLSPAGQVAFVSPAAIHVLVRSSWPPPGVGERAELDLSAQTPAWTLAPPSDTSVQRSVSTVSMRLLPGLEVPTSERSAALSHAAYAAIPIEPLLSRAKDDYDTNRSRSKGQSGVPALHSRADAERADYASFPVGLDKLVWKTAAWSPQPFGSLHR